MPPDRSEGIKKPLKAHHFLACSGQNAFADFFGRLFCATPGFALACRDTTGRTVGGTPVMGKSILKVGIAALALTFALAPWLAAAHEQSLDYEYGLGWHEKAAEAGSAEAEYRLGRFHETGVETAPDPAAARLWYGRAAERGHALAQLRLALLLHRGVGGPVDLAGAVRWYDAAAVRGLPLAQHNLAALLERGEGVEADPVTAARLYDSAARAGIAAAASQLAIMLIEGRGLDEDKVAALAWLILAADGGAPGAARLRDKLSAELGTAARRDAEARAAALRPAD
jgi:TPR repeat protein